MIGILGGTFDPVHFGHLRMAVELCQRLRLTQLRLIPCHQPPHRDTPQCSSEHRLAMVRLAVRGTAELVVDDREIGQTGPSYTVKTLQSLRQEMGPDVALCLTMGSDAFLGLPSWHRWQEIIDLAHIVVMTRPGWQLQSSANSPAGHVHTDLQNLLRTRQISRAEHLSQQAAGRLLLLPVTALDISASAIRQLISRGESPRFLLPDPVWDYIRERRLYLGPPDTGT